MDNTPLRLNPFAQQSPAKTQSPAMRFQDLLPAMRENPSFRNTESPLTRKGNVKGMGFGGFLDDEGRNGSSELLVKQPVLSASTSSKSLQRTLSAVNGTKQQQLQQQQQQLNPDPYTALQDFDKFAQIFERTPELYVFHESQGLAPLYEKVCEETVGMLGETEATEPVGFAARVGELKMWEEERGTWMLIQRLYSWRSEGGGEKKDQVVPNVDLMYASDQCFVNYIMDRDSELAEINIVKDWLQEIAPSFQPVETRKGYWFYTQRSMKDSRTLNYFAHSGHQNTISELDPDAPTRQRKQLNNEDAAYDRGLIKTIFEYVRRGRHEEAVELCRTSDQPWRAASIMGTMYYVNPNLDPLSSMTTELGTPQGNNNRVLWKGTCYQLSKEPSFDPYERALYSVLSGDLENLLSVCHTWEDYVWAHYCALIESRIEKRMKQRLKEVHSDLPIPTAYDDLSKEVIFDNAFKYEIDLKRGPVDQFHFIQSMIILGRTDELIEEMMHRLVEENWDVHFANPGARQHMLRFMAHFVAYLRLIDIEVPKNAADMIMKTYVELLIASKKNRLVALYTSKLPYPVQIETFAAFLQTIEDPKPVRWEYVTIAYHFGLDTRQILIRTVERIFEETMADEDLQDENQLSRDEQNSKTTPNDNKIIRALEWLTFQPQHYEHALFQSNFVQRRFLARRKIPAAYHAMLTLPDDIVQQEWMDQMDESDSPIIRAVTEHMHYIMLYDANISFNEWSEWYMRSPVESNNVLARQQQLEWNSILKTRTKRCEDYLRALLDSDWLNPKNIQGSEEDDRRDQELLYIRQLYIPELVMELHTILFETRDIIPGNLKQSLQVTIMVADETKKLYREFVKAQKMPALLSILRRSQVHALGEM